MYSTSRRGHDAFVSCGGACFSRIWYSAVVPSHHNQSLQWLRVPITETVCCVERFVLVELPFVVILPSPSLFRSTNTLLDRLTFNTPRRPYERERLDQELRICGEYGLRCKREIWRVQLVLAKIRKVCFGRWLVM